MRLFCFGLGYTALRIAERLQAEGWNVAGTCRSADKQADLKSQGIDAFLFDGKNPIPTPSYALSGVTHILSSIPPDESGDPVLRLHLRDIASLPSLKWAGYLSTTGVYGDRGGDWVDESTPRAPTTERGKRRATAEMAWQELHRTALVPVHLFRLPGIYGPGRSTFDAIAAGRTRRIFKEGQLFSRIHVDDLATAIVASMHRPKAGAIYNICDDEPAPPQDVTAYACDLAGVPVEPLTPIDEAALSPMAASFYSESKRVRNTRMKVDLGVNLVYPTYREGLDALFPGQE